jgi:hypothetical protein
VQAVADVFETAITEHPADGHMLQALWTEDLDERRRSRGTDEHGAAAGQDAAP